MTILKIIETFTFYGIDVMLLASLTTLFVHVLKISVLRKMQKKLLTFVPFIVGTALYAAYASLKALSFEPVLSGYTEILEHGISVGALSTLLYVLYEQFVRREKTGSTVEEVIKTLIDGYVPEAKVADVAAEIASAIGKDVTGSGARRTTEILGENAADGITDDDVALLAKLIIEAIAHLSV